MDARQHTPEQVYTRTLLLMFLDFFSALALAMGMGAKLQLVDDMMLMLVPGIRTSCKADRHAGHVRALSFAVLCAKLILFRP